MAGGRTAGSLTLCRTRLSRSRLPDQVIEDSSAGPGYHEAVCRIKSSLTRLPGQVIEKPSAGIRKRQYGKQIKLHTYREIAV